MSERRIPVLNWLEITPPQPGKNFSGNLDKQITQLEAAKFPAGTVVELTCRPPKDTTNYNPITKVQSFAEASRAIIAIGHEPRVHLAARMFDPASARQAVKETSEMGAKGIFLIAGDGRTPYSPDLTNSLELARLALEVNPKIAEIGFAAYPGLRHPTLARHQLWDSMIAKTRLKQDYPDVDIAFHTQFEPKASRIDALARKLKELNDCPLRVGLLGPTNFSTLLRVAEFAGFSPWELVVNKPDLVAGVLLSSAQQRLSLGSPALPEFLNYRPDGLVQKLNTQNGRSDNITGFYIYSMNNFEGSRELLTRLTPSPSEFKPRSLHN